MTMTMTMMMTMSHQAAQLSVDPFVQCTVISASRRMNVGVLFVNVTTNQSVDDDQEDAEINIAA